MSLRGLKSIYSYTDYRAFLRDCFSERSKDDPSYSHREMSKELGFPSPNYIKLVMDGKRDIGRRSISRLVEGLKLRSREIEYFCHLVYFCQAATAVEKNYHFGRLAAFKAPLNTARLTPAEYRYYDKWYNCVVRELIVREKAPVDFKRIAFKVRPHITAAQARDSAKLLLELGLIKQREGGGYEQSARLIATDREVTSLGIRNYHLKMIELGKESIDTVPGEKREISSLSLCISDACRQRIKQRVQDFEDEILQMARQDSGSDSVYQLNFQFFPLSHEDNKV